MYIHIYIYIHTLYYRKVTIVVYLPMKTTTVVNHYLNDNDIKS